MVVASYPAGILRRRRETRDSGEPVDAFKDRQITAYSAKEFGSEQGAEAWHAEHDLCLVVFAEALGYQRVQGVDLVLNILDFLRELGDHRRTDPLGGNGGVLGFRCSYGPFRHIGAAAGALAPNLGLSSLRCPRGGS